MTKPLVVIIGAGIAGLGAAWWLEKSGWRAIVVERAQSLRENGYMLGLSGPGYQTVCRMGLLDVLKACSYEIGENVYRDRQGRELLRLRYRDFLQGLPYLAVRRTDLVRALHDAKGPDTEIRMATTVVGLDDRGEHVDVLLDSGETLHADLVIGADGIRSGTRKQLFGADGDCLVPLGYSFAVYDVENTAGLESDFVSYVEPGHLAEYYALHDGRLAAMHVWRNADAEAPAPAHRWERLDVVTRSSHSQVHTLLKQARTGPPPVVDSLTMIDLPQWSKGRIVLLGDAAHCLTLISGQGAGIALASAEILGEELARGSVGTALAAHERRLRPSIGRLQARSHKMAAVFIPARKWTFHLRNVILRYMPRAWLGRYFTNAIRSEISLIEK